MSPAWLVTDLGDLFAASSVALAVAVWIGLNLSRLSALAWLVCYGATFGVVVLVKLWTARHFPQPDMTPLWAPSAGAPSGHAALATMVYGGAAALFLKTGRGLGAKLAAGVSLGILALICVTRVTLHTHTIADVVAGAAVASAFLALFARVLDVQASGRALKASPLLVSMLIIAAAAVASGVRISSDHFL